MTKLKTWLVVGIGNPGAQYAATRHNVGQMVLETIADRHHLKFTSHRTHTRLLDTRIGVGAGGAPGPRVILAMPNSYMNESGGPVKALMQWAHIEVDQLLVVHDEIDLPLHCIKLKKGGSEAGHNGLRSITKAIGSNAYARLRVGIDKPKNNQPTADYVIRPFAAKDLPDLGVTLEKAADCLEDIILRGIDAAQMTLHTVK